jgi:hypothetical protein
MSKLSKPAAGTEGFLLIYPDLDTAVETGRVNERGQKILDCSSTKIVFRIYEYEEDGKIKKNEKGHPIYKDYDVHHHDLKIKLLDGYFHETEKGNFLGYPK